MKLTVKQSMSKSPITVQCEESLVNAYHKMKKESYRHLPVVDEYGDLIGIISDRDFKRAMYPSREFNQKSSESLFSKNAKVSDFMSWPVKALTTDSDLTSAVKLMLDEKISAIVVTENGEVIGILTHEDLLRVLAGYIKQPENWKDKTLAALYKSPLGHILDMLADAGL